MEECEGQEVGDWWWCGIRAWIWVHHSLKIQGQFRNGCDEHGDGVVGPALCVALDTKVPMGGLVDLSQYTD